MFEKAAKCKLRFQSSKGALSVEDLFDLSLTSLDNLAKDVNRQLKAEVEESFIEKKSQNSSDLELRLDILKHVIAYKVGVFFLQNPMVFPSVALWKILKDYCL